MLVPLDNRLVLGHLLLCNVQTPFLVPWWSSRMKIIYAEKEMLDLDTREMKIRMVMLTLLGTRTGLWRLQQ